MSFVPLVLYFLFKPSGPFSEAVRTTWAVPLRETVALNTQFTDGCAYGGRQGTEPVNIDLSAHAVFV